MSAVVADKSTIAEHIRYRKPRTSNHSLTASETDPNITRSKFTISSLLSSSSSTYTTTSDNLISTTTAITTSKKKNFTSSTFRGLGCAASSQVSVPAVIRTSANWDSEKLKKKKMKSKKTKLPSNINSAAVTVTNNNINNANPSTQSSLSLALSSSCVGVPDVWCGPGIGVTTDAASVDCVVSRRPPVSTRGKVDGVDKINHNLRERSCTVRRMVNREDLFFLDSEAALGVPRSRADDSGSRRHVRHGFPEGLAEIVMLQSSLLMGGRSDGLDQYGDWRLDVDSMSYEELLELGERIGYVSTGLREEEITHCLRRTKLGILDNFSSHFPTELEKKCSICQDYEADDEMGKLNCGHFYHTNCIKEWLVQKNICPICKTAAVSQT
ncbi:E3 ubiquitin- ligase MBR2-like [Olea europaea subsp. europaea]|uniref:RING-type E3 ubiquitin transferase n=1 Tax=Olea europaea subsp. europaea TaxID=158383 RepID=A0A8S0RL28_OLEEU|nr:E3 ubiquitin- ligase MBR2-like [Olea europaea subsp. europaea]